MSTTIKPKIDRSKLREHRRRAKALAAVFLKAHHANIRRLEAEAKAQ